MLRSFGEGKMFFTARFHPSDDKQNVIMGGCADKKIHQWDSDTGDLVQVTCLLLSLVDHHAEVIARQP